MERRNWLCYSQKCRQSILLPMQAVFTKRSTQRMMAHESSKAHRDATKTLWRRAKSSDRVNSLLIDLCLGERVYAKPVLQRVVATIKFLTERGLAFRGDDQVIGSPSNGNFLGTLELLSHLSLFSCSLGKVWQQGEGVSFLPVLHYM